MTSANCQSTLMRDRELGDENSSRRLGRWGQGWLPGLRRACQAGLRMNTEPSQVSERE